MTKSDLDYTDIPGNISAPRYSGDFETAYKEIEKGCRGLIAKIKIDLKI